MSIEDDKTPIVEIDYGPATSRFQLEKPVKGKIVNDEPLARGIGTITDNSLIGKQRSDIYKWEQSIENLKLRIKDRQDQIRAAKKKIKLYERAAAIETTKKTS